MEFSSANENSASEADLIRNQKLLNEPLTVPSSQRNKELAVNKLTLLPSEDPLPAGKGSCYF